MLRQDAPRSGRTPTVTAEVQSRIVEVTPAPMEGAAPAFCRVAACYGHRWRECRMP